MTLFALLATQLGSTCEPTYLVLRCRYASIATGRPEPFEILHHDVDKEGRLNVELSPRAEVEVDELRLPAYDVVLPSPDSDDYRIRGLDAHVDLVIEVDWSCLEEASGTYRATWPREDLNRPAVFGGCLGGSTPCYLAPDQVDYLD